MACKEQNFFFEAADVFFGIEHCREITTVDEASLPTDWDFDLNGIMPASASTDEFINEFNGYVYAGLDPAFSGKTGLEIVLSGGETAAEVATAIKDAIEADATFSKYFNVEQDGSSLDIENKIFGAITAEGENNSGFTFNVGKTGSGGYLGRTADAIEVSLTTNAEVVNTNQGASNKEDEIYTGADANATVNLVELTKARFEALLASVGDKVTTSNGDVLGVGESKLFESLSANGGRMVLHPTRLDNNDRSKDFSFHKSSPKPQTLNFDGTALQQFAIQFDAYLDRKIDDKVNLYTVNSDWADLLGAV